MQRINMITNKKITELMVNPYNPRHNPVLDEITAINLLIEESPTDFFELINSINDQGFFPQKIVSLIKKDGQLVVIDGGKGQLSFAFEALAELGLTDKLTVIALAERLEEVYRVGDPYPLFIDRNSPALKVLQQIRDEAHRFGITFHRKLRSKAQIKSALKEIKGVGEKTEQRLLLRFGSVARVAAATIDELTEMVGEALAVKIKEALGADASQKSTGAVDK